MARPQEVAVGTATLCQSARASLHLDLSSRDSDHDPDALSLPLAGGLAAARALGSLAGCSREQGCTEVGVVGGVAWVPIARSLRQSQAHAPAARPHTGCSLGAHLWPAVSVGSSSAMCRVGGPGHEPGKTTDTCSPRSRSPVEERGLGVEVVGGAGVCNGVCPPRVPTAGVRARAGRGGRSAALRSVPGQACGRPSCSECPGPAGPAGCVAALCCSPATVFIGQVSSGTGTCADRTSPNPGSCACPGRTAQEAGAPSPRGGWRASGHSPALLLEEEAEPGALSLAGGRYPRPAAQIALPDTRAPHRPHPPRPRPAAT
ncbi:cuticle collagen 2-like [Pteropus vampyrus]|uniref:Cuticle collagen 2-like n=1 Tax=Pteropus vampyrus TaxID=132908 RepID=A0A6P6BRK0_PTEVA|nr:cuticle collagen 2-like [Pteropus vampyrus]